MSRHSFNIPKYSDDLTTMGASWFVSYSFYTYISKSHKNWEKVKTRDNRIAVFDRLKQNEHRTILNYILTMDDQRLNTNKIGLKADAVKSMAQQILNSLK